MNLKRLYRGRPGSITVYAFIVFGIVVSCYFMGYESPLIDAMTEETVIEGDNGTTHSVTLNSDPVDVGHKLINAIINVLMNPMYLGSLLVVGLVSFLTAGGTRYMVTFIAPALILLVVLNVIILPINFIYDSSLPFEIKLLVFSFLNLFLMLSIIEFIAGRE